MILHLRWNLTGLAIRPSQQVIGLGVSDARFSLDIETEGPASAKCDVPQVAHTRAFVSFLDIGIGPADVRPRRVLDAINEIALMDRTFDALLFDVAVVSGLDAFFHVPALSVEDQGS